MLQELSHGLIIYCCVIMLNIDDPFVRDSNFILKGFANMDDTLKNHLENGQECAQRKFRMKSLLVLQNLFE